MLKNAGARPGVAQNTSRLEPLQRFAEGGLDVPDPPDLGDCLNDLLLQHRLQPDTRPLTAGSRMFVQSGPGLQTG